MSHSFYSAFGISHQQRRCGIPAGRHHLSCKFPLVLIFALLVAGCGGLSIPVGSASGTHERNEDPAVTGSVSSNGGAEDAVLPADRFAISDAIGRLNRDDEARLPLAWHSETSGNQGSILSLSPLAVRPGLTCLEFVTTANTFQGLENYNGTACRDDLKNWQVIQLRNQIANSEPDSS